MLKGAEFLPSGATALEDRSGSPESEDMEKDVDIVISERFDSAFNVIMMGDSGVGKTDLIGRLCQNQNFKTQFFATIGINMESHIIDIDGHKSKLQIWDPSGSERFRKVVTQYFPIAKGIVFVYDVNYDKSFHSIQQWVHLVQTHPEIDRDLPKCLIGNKCDMSAKRRMISTSEGESLAVAYGMRFFETSSISGLNVQEAFAALCQDMLKYEPTSSSSISNSVPCHPVSAAKSPISQR